MPDQLAHRVSTLAWAVSLVEGKAPRAVCGARMDLSQTEIEALPRRCPWCAAGEPFLGTSPDAHTHDTTWLGELRALVLRKPLIAVCGSPMEEDMPHPPPRPCPACFPEPQPGKGHEPLPARPRRPDLTTRQGARL